MGCARRRPRVGLAGLLWALGSVASVASAHTIVVDGDAGDWPLGSPTFTNTAHVARSASEQGAFVWRDSTSDARTTLADPETDAEITELNLTGDSLNLYALVRLKQVTQSSGANTVQVQIAVDRDRVAGSGAAAFAAGADLSVAASARWEVLLVTRFASGDGDLDVFDPMLGVSRAGQAVLSQAGDLIELAVPWTALGSSGPPGAALRFSVASFRADAANATVDLGGPSEANALDVVSNNETPGFTVPTVSETGDQVLDYHFDVWFDSQGEVVAPLLITAFEARPASFIDAEWIELHNPGAVAVAADGFRLGDEETPGASEAMAAFPPASVAPGAFIVVARSASAYAAGTGMSADFEFDGTDGAVPDLIGDPAWGTGAMVLADGGDQLLLLDERGTIIDAVAFGTAALAGVESMPAPASGEVDYRAPVARDRNLAGDFSFSAVDLVVTLTDGADSIVEGGTEDYLIEVTNRGPDDAFAAAISLDLLDGLVLTDSTCMVLDLGAACSAIDPVALTGTLDLPRATRVEYTLTAQAQGFAAGPARLHVSAAPPDGVGERVPLDNSAADTNTILPGTLFADSFE